MSDDHDTIKKKSRVIDHDRQKYQQAVQQSMSRTNEAINALRKENEKLQHELGTTMGGAGASGAGAGAGVGASSAGASGMGGSFRGAEQDQSAQLEQEIESLQRRVNFERMRSSDLDKKLAVCRIDMARARKNMGGVNITSDNTVLVEKQVRVLENRLDQALVQFNEALAYNRQLRATIDNLRGERKVFSDIYKKLEAELHEKKKAMADVIEKSNRDYEERDALQVQLESLKAAAKEDLKKYDEHFARLDDMMIKYKATREAQQQQAAQQAAQQQAEKNAMRRGDTGKDDGLGGTGGAGASGKGGSGAGGAGGAGGQNPDGSMKAGDDVVDEEADLQEVVDQLKEATGVQDLDVLHQKFVKAEEHNFSTYNFVNELNTEAESLEKEIEGLQAQLAKERGDAQRTAALKSLENELARTEATYESTVGKTQRNQEQLGAIRTISQDIFTKIGCAPEVAEDVLGTTECTELNLLPFLGIIEQRTNELLFAFNQATAAEMRKRAQGKDDDARRRRERRQQERQARIDAGEAVGDEHDDEDEEDEEDAGQTAALAPSRAKFVGQGPTAPRGAVTAQTIVRREALPTTTTGDATGGDGHDDVEEDLILDHAQLREQMEHRLQAKREKEEKAAGKKKNRNKK